MRRFTAMTAVLIAAPLVLALPAATAAEPAPKKKPVATTVDDDRNDVQLLDGEALLPSDAPIDIKKAAFTYSRTGTLTAKATFYKLDKTAWDLISISIDLVGNEISPMYADYYRGGDTMFYETDNTENPDCPITGRVKRKSITVKVAASCFDSPAKIPAVAMFVLDADGNIDSTNSVSLRSR